MSLFHNVLMRPTVMDDFRPCLESQASEVYLVLNGGNGLMIEPLDEGRSGLRVRLSPHMSGNIQLVVEPVDQYTVRLVMRDIRTANQ